MKHSEAKNFNSFFIILTLFLIRLFHLFIVRSWYVPDEYWQSLEIAHFICFGYGYRTWEWIIGIRSYISISWIVLLYKLLHLLSIDTIDLLIWSPRFLQSLLSVYSDYCFTSWLQKYSNTKSVVWPTIFYITCPFLAYCSTRTIVNTTELSLTSIALYYYPWTSKNRDTAFIWVIGVLCIIRPTAIIIWLPLFTYDFITHRRYTLKYLRKYISTGLVLIILSLLIDSYFHGSIVFTQWNFLLFNVIKKVNEHYSTEHWSWYFTCGLPPILGPIFILFVFVIFKKIIYYNFTSIHNKLFITIMWSLFIFSLIGHKEHRFLLPLIPMILFMTSDYIHYICTNFKKVTFFVIIMNNVILIYLGRYHQIGSINVMSYLTTLPLTSEILFLMPCHSTPLYSHLHRNISTKILTCEPNINEESYYKDEADLFFDNPLKWLDETYYKKKVPSHIVIFNVLANEVQLFLKEKNYTVTKEFFHTHFPSERVGSKILVYSIF
ncbi:GPI mannosyltransferase 3 [Daktulosphaira vitifoliae]|uniref:GPI mannosyltransferase 3 n=1 Tax=Daktulosphaira vitifoliae TaxID=58002 RepID=UPI0021A9DFF4|nr:GPI mannosyltransferase 3 [Daktulosphaira vitifoliae]